MKKKVIMDRIWKAYESTTGNSAEGFDETMYLFLCKGLDRGAFLREIEKEYDMELPEEFYLSGNYMFKDIANKIEREKNATDYRILTEQFLDFESERGLFGVTINGVYVWPYLRFFVFSELVKQCCWQSIGHTVSSPKKYVGKMDLKKKYDKYIRRNALLVGKRDVLIIASARKMKVGDYYRDISTYWLDHNMKRSHYVLDVNVSKTNYILEDSLNLKQFNEYQYLWALNKEYHKYMTDKDEFEKKIVLPVEEYFDLDIPLNIRSRWIGIVNYRVTSEETIVPYLNFLLNRIRPKLVITVANDNCHNQIANILAKKKGIPTVELAHGIVGKGTILFNYREKRKLPSMPDYFFSFGNYDVTTPRWPFDKSRVYPVGSPELDFNVKKYKKDDVVNGKKTILFVSSGMVKLFDCIREFSEMINETNYEIILKLHPGECDSWERLIKPILGRGPITVIDTYEAPIYFYFGKADWVVGIDSTAMYEATAFGVKVAVMDVESLGETDLVKSGNAILFNNAEELKDIIMRDDFLPDETNEFFSPNSIERMNDAIEDIIKRNNCKRIKGVNDDC